MTSRSAEPHALTASHVYDRYRERLAYYQVPRHIEMVRELPYGPTQRVRKGQLSRSTKGIFDAEARWPRV
ncbi:hypothetical protein [Nonomuraea guangzhouensis]|uniref:Uncharacterized protein n=1 Tax=Nonomuraea guangzhouensis TaxID=1291555 RepID=A0ABW4GHK1_9ACTN|nr:hypothetical protein [Nonomuraea guangzhouensis]